MGAYEHTTEKRGLTSKGSTSDVATHLLAGPFDSRRVVSVRPHLLLESPSGGVEVQFIYQTSDDNGITWSASTSIGAWLSSAGWIHGTTFTTVTAAQQIRFGVQARNTTGTNREAVRVQIRIEAKFI